LSENPFGTFKHECLSAIKDTLKRRYADFEPSQFLLSIPPSPRFGDLTSPVCFELSKKYGENSTSLARILEQDILRIKFTLVEKVESLNGYLNFFVNFTKLSSMTYNVAEKLGQSYGLVKTDKPERIIVEHTSANPSGPLHVGTARNAILGDALARTLEARGHQVKRHFYVDDVGKQVATVAYGFRNLGKLRVEGKPDTWIGFVYAVTNCTIMVRALKERIRALHESQGSAEGLEHAQRQLDEYMAAAVELESLHKDDFYRVVEGVNADPNPEKSIENIVKLYEQGDPPTRRQVRGIVEACLRGFRQTLNKAGIKFNSWDWESELAWSSEVKKTVEKLSRTPYVFKDGDALALNVDLAAENLGIKQKVAPDMQSIPPLVLVRSDATSLYTTRDIAYHLKKFEWAEKGINVIGVDQKLAQIQLKVALLTLGLKDALENLVHYSYELVRLPGYKMSRRRGRYVTFDEIIEEAVTMAYSEVAEREPEMSEKQKLNTAKTVGLGAVKYAMLSVSATKTVNFTWDSVLNFETNSGPFIQYAHARACSILRKAKFKPANPDYSLLQHPLEKQLTFKLSMFPQVFSEAADNLKPELIVEYVNDVANAFNAFYNELPVIKAGTRELRDARLIMVRTTKTVLGNALRLLGIKAPSRM